LYKTSLPVSSGAVSAVAQAMLRAMTAQRNRANSFFMDDSPFFICCFVKQLIQSVFIIVAIWKKFNRIFYLYIAKTELQRENAQIQALGGLFRGRKNAGKPRMDLPA